MIIELENDHLAPCQIVRAEGLERINALGRWELHLLVPSVVAEADSAVGSTAKLTLADELDGSVRTFDLVVAHVQFEGPDKRGFRYAVTLHPPEWMLTHRAGHRIFIEKNALQIVAETLTDAGIPPDRLVQRVAGDVHPRAQCTQFGESEWLFIERLLAEEGISYWCDFQEGIGSTLVLGDGMASHEGIPPPVEVPYQDASGMVSTRSITALEVSEEMVPDGMIVRDFDIRQPDVLIEGTAGGGGFPQFEYPANVPAGGAAADRARIRLEQLQKLKSRATGSGDVFRLAAGRRIHLEGAADAAMNVEYLVTEVRHTYVRPTPESPNAKPYSNEFVLVPGTAPSFRPDPPVATPLVEGIESAVTTGPKGEEIHVDDLGRVKLRFFWDPSGIQDDTSSAWARCLQLAMGGAMMLPRVGWEVPVAYLDGMPDRPFVLGRHYNATAVVPYDLPGAAATTSIQSASSPGGGSTNEIRMGDGAGKQEVFINASKDQSVAVGASATQDIGADLSHDIGLMLAQVVVGSQTHSVGGPQSVDVGTDFVTGVKGAASLSVGAAEILNVTANRSVTTGSYSELIGAVYALQSNQSNFAVGGSFLQVNGGGTLLNAGMGVSETVAGLRGEYVAGNYSVSTGKFNDSTLGAKRLSAGGAASESAGGAITLEGRIGKVKAASATLKASGVFTISGAAITIEAASLTAGALQLAGGALKATKGTTGIKGTTVTHKSGIDIEMSTGFIFELAIEGAEVDFRVLHVRGKERIHEPFSFEIACHSRDKSTGLTAHTDALALVTAHAKLSWTVAVGNDRILEGIVDEAEIAHDAYTFTFVPTVTPLLDGTDHRTFVEQDAIEITKAILDERGLELDVRTTRTLPKRPHCLQNFEKNIDFISRIMADEGIAWFLSTDGKKVVLADAPSAYVDLEGDPVPIQETGGLIRKASVSRARLVRKTVPDKIMMRDYDFTKPLVDQTVEESLGDGTRRIVESPGGYTEPDIGHALAKIRLEEARQHKLTLFAETNVRSLSAGSVITLTGGAEAEQEGRWLLVEVEHEMRVIGESEDPYVARFSAVPADGGYRPPRRKPQRLGGVQTATVTGPPGAEIHPDEFGRVRVKHRWDRRGPDDDKSSGWVRSFQPNLSGSIMVPRTGWEVLVGFGGSRGDEPMVMGRLYNATAPPPSKLPGAKVVSSLGTLTTPGGGSSNGISMNDTKGSEGMSMGASADLNEQTANDKVTAVKASDTWTVGGGRKLAVGTVFQQGVDGAQTYSVGAMRTVNVGANLYLTAASQSVSVGAVRLITTGGDHSTGCSGFTRIVLGAEAQADIEHQSRMVKGKGGLVNGGGWTINAGTSASVSIGGASGIKIGGNKSIKCAAYSVSAKGILSEKYASRTAKAGAAITEKFSASGTYDISGAASMEGSDIEVSAKTSLTIKAGGVTIKLTPGKISVDGQIKGDVKSEDKGTHKFQ